MTKNTKKIGSSTISNEIEIDNYTQAVLLIGCDKKLTKKEALKIRKQYEKMFIGPPKTEIIILRGQ